MIKAGVSHTSTPGSGKSLPTTASGGQTLSVLLDGSIGETQSPVFRVESMVCLALSYIVLNSRFLSDIVSIGSGAQWQATLYVHHSMTVTKYISQEASNRGSERSDLALSMCRSPIPHSGVISMARHKTVHISCYTSALPLPLERCGPRPLNRVGPWMTPP